MYLLAITSAADHAYLDVIAAKLRDDGDLACFVVSFSGRKV